MSSASASASAWHPPRRLLRVAFLDCDVVVLNNFIDLALRNIFEAKLGAAPAALKELLQCCRRYGDLDYKIYCVLVLMMCEPSVCSSIERHDLPQVMKAFIPKLQLEMDYFLTGLKPGDGGRYVKDDPDDLQFKSVPFFVDLMRQWYLML